MNKVILRPERLRHLPPQFSWLDQRLARNSYFEHASADSGLLYLFLVTVADAQGLSYYAERTLSQRLRLSGEQLSAARRRLLALDLIAYRPPLYQVLELERPVHRAQRPGPRPPAAQVEHHLRTLHQALHNPGASS